MRIEVEALGCGNDLEEEKRVKDTNDVPGRVRKCGLWEDGKEGKLGRIHQIEQEIRAPHEHEEVLGDSGGGGGAGINKGERPSEGKRRNRLHVYRKGVRDILDSGSL